MSEDEIEQMFYRDPFLRFSMYTQGDVRRVRALGAQLRKRLDGMRVGEAGQATVDGLEVFEAYDEFWFWVLGAYEVVRTLHQRKKVLSEDAGVRVGDFKRRIARLRIPFAKQEYQGKHGITIGGENSVDSLGPNANDLCYTVKDEQFSARELTSAFDELVESFVPADVMINPYLPEHLSTPP